MAGADYDGIAGVMRLLEAGGNPSTFAIEVVTYHAAIESELELIIATLVQRPEGLFTTTPFMSFPHKAHLLRAVWKGKPEQADILHDVLHRFQNVRNAVAHPNDAAIKGNMAALTQAYRNIDPAIGDEVEILEVAQGICLFMQDGSNVTELQAKFDGLAHLVNVAMPKALRGQGDDA